MIIKYFFTKSANAVCCSDRPPRCRPPQQQQRQQQPRPRLGRGRSRLKQLTSRRCHPLPIGRVVFRYICRATPPPCEVPQSLLPPPRRRRSSSKATVTATGTAGSSLSPVDPSLPYAADEVTAIFPSRSQSHEKASPMGRSDDGTHPTNATTEFISPIRDAHTMDELSSLSSAGSYLRGGDGEKGEMTP